MVGIVIVSHSARLAEGVVELAREMGGPDVALEPAGGIDEPRLQRGAAEVERDHARRAHRSTTERLR